MKSTLALLVASLIVGAVVAAIAYLLLKFSVTNAIILGASAAAAGLVVELFKRARNQNEVL